MKEFTHYVSGIIDLDTHAQADFDLKIKTAEFKKGELIISKQRICKNIYYLKKGIIKFYFINDEGKEVIFRFFSEHTLFTSLESFILQKPTAHMLLTLEPVVVDYISKQDLDNLSAKHHSISKLNTYILSLATTNMIKRFTELMSERSIARYNNFVSENSDLMQRISLGDLANYLGITQVSLSRIRATK
ncbi:MAG TPA: Crp/Fnr family transcriptional regulator [Saprospiraceae bacterium]|nr:Crp/Fnr family transcriptional regulator [Saprospiraceae bacterium]HPN70599.1 Crp/Fnr family transcriptional regulator [Saprospiraceae bacterium]